MATEQPILYLFIGFPGSGKTTVANLISETTGAVHLWADHERQAMFESVDHSAAESDALYEALNTRTEQLLASGQSVVFDTNFNYLKDRDKLRTIATKHNARTLVIWMQTPVETARRRALDASHRDRNRYTSTMTDSEFARLIDHLQPPTVNERYITIDGSDIDIEDVKRQLSI